MRLNVDGHIVIVTDETPEHVIQMIEASKVRASTILTIESEIRQLHHAQQATYGTVCACCRDEMYPCPTLRLVRKILRVSRA